MDLSYQRRIDVNEMIITTRWFYMVAVFLIGILGNSLVSLFSLEFSFFSIALLLVLFLVTNAYLFQILNAIKKTESEIRLKILSTSQIVIELMFFALAMRLVGEESVAGVFFFLPIISAAIIFGLKGAVLTACAAVVLVNMAVFGEYLDVLTKFVFTRSILNPVQLKELQLRTFGLVNVFITSNFYLVVAVVSGYSYKLIFKREQKLIVQAEQLSLERAKGREEVEKMDRDAKLLTEQDRKLKAINIELNKRLNQLANSEKSIIRAFSDLQAARRKADDERQKTAAIISNFIDPIIVIDNEHRINLMNPPAKEVFGLSDADLGKPVAPEGQYSLNNFKTYIKQDFSVRTGKELKAPDPNEEEVAISVAGQELTYKVITAPVMDNARNHLGTMKIFYNLTREKMIDKLKSEFISIAAHQLRTPLSAIKWVMKMVLDGDIGPLSEEQKVFLYKGYQSNERIINLVNDMLNVSRIEEGRFGYVFQSEDFCSLVRSVAENSAQLVQSKKIKFSLDLPGQPAMVYMDRSKMELVVQNLLENAVKYTPEFGRIRIAVESGAKFVKVKVADNGVGIPEKDKPKLFSKFFRAENVVRMQTEGSGLGLFMVKNIIKRHGGEITFESEEGKGTEFVFTLPVGEANNSN